MRKLLILLTIAGSCIGQTTDTSPRMIANGSVLPPTCKVGQVFFLTGVAAGSNLYGCTAAPSTWSLEGTGGGGGGSTSFPINPQTATYQVLAADFAACKVISAASGTFTITLVAGGGTQPANGQCIWVFNYGSGVVTIVRSSQNINGGTASLVLPASSASNPTSAFIVSDGTNYFASVQEIPASTVCANQVVTAVNGTAQATCTTITSLYVDTSIAKTGIDINTSNQVTATHLAAPLPVAQGGTATGSTLSGVVRGGNPLTASEMSGDCTTSGSNALTCAKLNGGSVPASAHVLGTNGSSQPVAATATDTSAITYVAGGGTAQAQTVTLAPAVTSLTTGLNFCFLPILANTAAAPTLAVNGLAAKPITKLGATAIVAGDLTTTAQACVRYDGTEFQLQNPQAYSPQSKYSWGFCNNPCTNTDSIPIAWIVTEASFAPTHCYVVAATPPVGANLIGVIKVNGTTAATFTAVDSTSGVQTFSCNGLSATTQSLLTANLTQVGSTTAGQYVTVTITQ